MPMRSVVLGTAGHIDHGKTALVRALTGTDTDRLKEEKARGITIELGFAELAVDEGPHFGVVDVPGHEAFVRAMVAGAAGMDVALLVIAADEGIMPQTREHLSILDLLGVPELVVALSKCDGVDPEWLELVDADVADVLSHTRYADAPRVATSATEGTGLEALLAELVKAAGRAQAKGVGDMTRLPIDRVFTIQGTGTVATGTLWSGELKTGDKVRILPDDLSARVRGLQVHGREAERAVAGDRTAVALTGEGGDRDLVSRGATLVTAPEWESSWMLTTRMTLIEDTPWKLEHNQRVHVHHGTAEVLARCALLEADPLAAGEAGWVQLRLETPLVARAGDRLVIRAYSPVITMGGGLVAEPVPPKRNRLSDEERTHLDWIVSGSPLERVEACLALAAWAGLARGALPIRTGLDPQGVAEALESLLADGAITAGSGVFSAAVADEAERRLVAGVTVAHASDSLRVEAPLAAVRAVLPAWAPVELADACLGRLVENGRLEEVQGGVRLPDFRPEPTPEQSEASARLMEALSGDGLAAPFLEELPESVRTHADFKSLLRRLESLDEVRAIADGLYIPSAALDAAEARIYETLAGKSDLGPGAFRDALPVSRKHLIPLLNYFDGRGSTVRHDRGRDVPA
jgi:selenocysteine-specific elongation factor